MKIAHISWLKRDDGSLGGVEKFAWLLREYVVPELTIIAQSDFPDIPQSLPAVEQVQAVTSHALAQGLVDGETTVIVDGFWGMGLEGKVKRLISIAHGTWLGNLIENERIPWDDPDSLYHLADLQIKFWQQDQVEIVAVSPQAAREVKWGTGRDVLVVLNAVDTDIFKPPQPCTSSGQTVVYVADRASKGRDIVEVLRGKMPNWDFVPLRITSGDLEEEADCWRKGNSALFPSRYEGCPYAWLEAMACGLPIVAYKTGLALDLPPECGEFVDDYHPRAFEEALKRVAEGSYEGSYYPERWMEENAGIKQWSRTWKAILKES